MTLKDHLESLHIELLCGMSENALNDDGTRRDIPATGYKHSMEGKRAVGASFGSLVSVCKMNVIGFLLGCALMRILGSHGSGYAAVGALFSIILGMIDCMIMRKMPLIHALVRNVILTVILAVVCLIFVIGARTDQ